MILLDEPAQNLHPNTQTAVLKAIQSHSQKQFIVVTHSPWLVTSDAIDAVLRLHLEDGHTVPARLDPTQWKERHLDASLQEFRQSTDIRSMLFSRGVILVEGPSEYAALPIWYTKHYGVPLQQNDLTIWWVDGYQNFAKYLRLLNAFAVRWAIVYDGDAISSAAKQMERVGVKCVPKHMPAPANLTPEQFARYRDELARCGAFTFAQDASGNFESLPVVQRLASAVPENARSDRVRVARRVAEESPCPVEIAELLQQVTAYLT